jgi:ABC-2 type transport system ATP-binding protein
LRLPSQIAGFARGLRAVCHEQATGREPDAPVPSPSPDPPSDAAEPAVRAVGLTRRFGDLEAVRALALEVPAGSIFGLLGPNGAGKTTTIKMLTTMLAPTAGHAAVAGFDVVRNAVAVRRRIGYVSQMLSADGALTGAENLMLFARLYGIPATERAERVTGALSFMGLEAARDELVRNFSGGMIRRLEIAQSMMHRPAVLFLDEPTIGLDPAARHAVWQHLRDLRERFGTTIVMTTHDMEEADVLCETIAIMHRGETVVMGAPADLKRRIGPDATLEDVFLHFAGQGGDDAAGFRDILQTRRTAKRLG